MTSRPDAYKLRSAGRHLVNYGDQLEERVKGNTTMRASEKAMALTDAHHYKEVGKWLLTKEDH